MIGSAVGRTATAAAALLGTVALWNAPAAAQSGDLTDFRLRPQPSASPSTTVVGPVDDENPTPTPTPRASPTPTPRATAAPPVVAPTTTPAATRAAPAATPAPVRPSLPTIGGAPVTEGRRPAPPGPTSEPAPAGDAGFPSLPDLAPAPPANVFPTAAPAPVENTPVADEPAGRSGLWLALLALLGLVGAAGALAWTRRRSRMPRGLPAPEAIRPYAPRAAAEPPEAAKDPQVAPVAAAPLAGPALRIELEATRMSATLVNATLSYRLAVTNTGGEALADVAVSGDMVAAHASRPAEELLAGPALAELHRIAQLGPGETVTLGGDLRLPLAAITPIRRGDARLFVPLARFRALARHGEGAVEAAGAFLVGQLPGERAEKLQPFRLDLGPRIYSRIGQRPLPKAA